MGPFFIGDKWHILGYFAWRWDFKRILGTKRVLCNLPVQNFHQRNPRVGVSCWWRYSRCQKFCSKTSGKCTRVAMTTYLHYFRGYRSWRPPIAPHRKSYIFNSDGGRIQHLYIHIGLKPPPGGLAWNFIGIKWGYGPPWGLYHLYLGGLTLLLNNSGGCIPATWAL